MDKALANRRSIGIVIASAAIFAVLLTLVLLATGTSVYYPYTMMEDGWRLRGTLTDARGGETHLEEESVSIADLPKGRRGDYFQISAELPDMGDIPFPTVMFETRYAAVEVSVDSTVIYRFGMERLGTRHFVGATYHLVTLPEEYAGKFVTITVYRTESNAGRAISTPYIGAHEDMESMLLHDNFFSLGCGFFLIVFGLSFLFLTLLYLNRVPELLPQLVSSLLCVAFGVILVCNDHVAFLFLGATGATVADYMAIYALVPLGYLLLAVLHVPHTVPQKLCRIAGSATIIAVLMFYALHFLNILHLNRMLFVYYVFAVIGMAIILLDIIGSFRERALPTAHVVTLFGLLALMFCAFLDMILIVLWRAGAPVGEGAGRGLIPLGAMIFASAQIINYLSFISESGSRQKDYASLQNIAYADALTGLANRARADKVFEELDRGREDYCLVSIDVNGLKDTNDRLGHVAGDRLLKDYAEALKASFGDEALCARMGGDEYLVVMKKTNADGFGVRLRRLYSDLDEMNEKDKTIFRSAAIGYAFRHECHGGDAHAVYLLADERMFENKREEHIRYRIKERT